jgi:hypothetical protein
MTFIKKYAYAFASALLAFMGIFIYAKGRSDQESEQVRNNLDAVREAKSVRDEVQKDPDLKNRAKKWVKQD